MNEKGEWLITTVIRESSLLVCTSEFFEEGEFSKGYEIVKVSSNCYGVVKARKPECKIFFEKIFKVKEDCYLLDCDDERKRFLKIERGEIFLSEPFKDVIQIFEKYILVSDFLEQRMLVPMDYFQDVQFCSWPNCEENGAIDGLNHAVMKLLNGKLKILVKDSLIVSDIEFDSVSGYSTTEVSNIFRIIYFKDENKQAVIRIKDLQKSNNFNSVNVIYYGLNSKCYTKYVQVRLDDNKKAILRVEDFKLSKGYDEIYSVLPDYALVIDEGVRNMFRLLDFKEAKW